MLFVFYLYCFCISIINNLLAHKHCILNESYIVWNRCLSDRDNSMSVRLMLCAWLYTTEKFIIYRGLVKIEQMQYTKTCCCCCCCWVMVHMRSIENVQYYQMGWFRVMSLKEADTAGLSKNTDMAGRHGQWSKPQNKPRNESRNKPRNRPWNEPWNDPWNEPWNDTVSILNLYYTGCSNTLCEWSHSHRWRKKKFISISLEKIFITHSFLRHHLLNRLSQYSIDR